MFQKVIFCHEISEIGSNLFIKLFFLAEIRTHDFFVFSS